MIIILKSNIRVMYLKNFLTKILVIFLTINSLFIPVHALPKDHNTSLKTAYLTFDDGPSNLTVEVLDILREKEVPATFFVLGKSIKGSEATLNRIAQEGHAIGNHTYSHNYQYIYKNVDNFLTDFYKCEELIFQITGLRPKILRYPVGTNNQSSKLYGEKHIMNKISQELEGNGYTYFDWNVSSRDANGQDYTIDELVDMTLSQAKLKNDSIILFHDTASKSKTVKALPMIIDGLREQGFIFNLLSESSFRVAFPLPKIKIAEVKKPEIKINKHPITKHVLWKLTKIEEFNHKYK